MLPCLAQSWSALSAPPGRPFCRLTRSDHCRKQAVEIDSSFWSGGTRARTIAAHWPRWSFTRLLAAKRAIRTLPRPTRNRPLVSRWLFAAADVSSRGQTVRDNPKMLPAAGSHCWWGLRATSWALSSSTRAPSLPVEWPHQWSPRSITGLTICRDRARENPVEDAADEQLELDVAGDTERSV